jgi:hypothetical protein
VYSAFAIPFIAKLSRFYAMRWDRMRSLVPRGDQYLSHDFEQAPTHGQEKIWMGVSTRKYDVGWEFQPDYMVVSLLVAQVFGYRSKICEDLGVLEPREDEMNYGKCI